MFLRPSEWVDESQGVVRHEAFSQNSFFFISAPIGLDFPRTLGVPKTEATVGNTVFPTGFTNIR